MRSLFTDRTLQAARAIVWVSALQAQQEHAPSGFGVPVRPGWDPDGSPSVPDFEEDPAPKRYHALAITLIMAACGRAFVNSEDVAPAPDWALYDEYLIRLQQQTTITQHETVAQLNAMNLAVGADLLHLGLTSSDATEPAVAAIADAAAMTVWLRGAGLVDQLASLANEQADWKVTGRTHGRPAAPTTWGMRWAGYAEALSAAVQTGVSAGVLRARRIGAGPVGNHAGWWLMACEGKPFGSGEAVSGTRGTPEYDLALLTDCATGRARLGLDDLMDQLVGYRPYSTDHEADGDEPEVTGEPGTLQYSLTLANNRAWAARYSPEGIGGAVAAWNAPGTQQLPHHSYTAYWGAADQIALVVRKITRDLRAAILLDEAIEQRQGGQVGSSAMPHKHNPVLTERAAALSHVVTGYTAMGRGSAESWLEGDVAESASRRVWLPGMFLAVDAMLITLHRALQRLQVDPFASERHHDEQGQELGTFDELTRLVQEGTVGRTEAHRRIATGRVIPRQPGSTGLSGWTAASVGRVLADGLTADSNPIRWE